MSAPVSRPHYLLFTEAKSRQSPGQWRFVVQALDGAEQVEVVDVESDICGDRLDLLTVIRGLESLDQPSRVTLVTSSRFVKQGIDEGLAEWRENDWMWERFGERVPVKHFDLWRRLDHALTIHQVQCRRWRLDAAHRVATPAQHREASRGDETVDLQPSSSAASEPEAVPEMAAAVAVHHDSRSSARRGNWRGRLLRLERWLGEQAQGLRLKASQFGTSILPAPWLE